MLKSILATAALLVSSTFAAPPELRGTWITTTANDAISTPQKTEETMRRLREIGLNTVYVECWKNGYTEYPSPTMKELVGVEMKVNGTGALQRNLLQENVIQAHRNGMLCVAWLEYGFMAAFKDSNNELRAKKEWITLTRDGKDVGTKNGFVWLNPFHPDVQEFLINITLDAIKEHDLDGIQLDDRIALPVDLGYDDYTRELYRKETGSYPPDDFNDPKWMKWRADKISEFALRYVTEIRTANPDLIISVSPAPYPWSYDNYLCDWMTWTRWCYCGGKRWNEYIPQCYRMTGPATIKSIQEQIDQIDEEKYNLAPGIRIVGDGPDMPWQDLKDSIDFCRKQELAGHVLWFSRGVLDVYPEQLKAYYDVANKGHAASPMKPGDWRPMPFVATRGEGNAWKVTLTSGGRYTIIAKKDGVWSEVASLQLKEGENTIVEEAEAVEVLVDRRP
jgi:uncharacterized lipoprotein YddW (UPF0748 family)